jgi:hypothetical protein
LGEPSKGRRRIVQAPWFHRSPVDALAGFAVSASSRPPTDLLVETSITLNDLSLRIEPRVVESSADRLRHPAIGRCAPSVQRPPPWGDGLARKRNEAQKPMDTRENPTSSAMTVKSGVRLVSDR